MNLLNRTSREANMDVNYEHYRVFYFVVKCGSFTKAAEALNSSQPNVTRTMNRLEEELGCELLCRSNRGASLTKEGSELFPYVETAVEALSRGEGVLAETLNLQRGYLTIGASENAMVLYLTEKLKEFHETYPGIRLHIHNYSTSQAREQLRQGKIDFAVVTTPVADAEGIEVKRLLKFQETLVAGGAFRRTAKACRRLADLEDYPLISHGKGTMTFEFYRQLFLEQGLIFRPDMEVASSDQVLSLVEHGLGLGFLPEQMTKASIRNGRLSRISLEEQIPVRHVVLLTRRDTAKIAARRFANMLQPR
ncbi:LysR family transcriptional regulator [Hornefia butyriciproducens]|uniref:LysR family transcriptional regulator n=1 Tax=Hornefia butyriciproducens TaxID=2652293 RepID=UPI003F8B95EA